MCVCVCVCVGGVGGGWVCACVSESEKERERERERERDGVRNDTIAREMGEREITHLLLGSKSLMKVATSSCAKRKGSGSEWKQGLITRQTISLPF